MSGQWSLKEIYPSYESTAYKEDLQKLEVLFKKLENTQLEDSLSCVRQVIEDLEQVTLLQRRLFAYSSLQLSTDTRHEPSLKHMAYLRKISATFAKTDAKIAAFLGSVTIDINQDPILADYAFLFAEYKIQASRLLSQEAEEVYAKLNQSAGTAWAQLQSFLTSSVEGEFKGETLTLSAVRNLAYSHDPAVRKAAYELELSMYETIKEPVAFAINNIKSQVNDMTSLRGYGSALEATLEQSRMSKETLNALIKAIQNALPSFRKYFRHKAKLLGHPEGLPFYDLFAPIGQAASRTFTAQETKDYLVSLFKTFSDDLADLTAETFDKDYVDLYPRKGKVGGAFCSTIPAINQSRILMNFDGSLRNVVTMAHELGHAYHGLHLRGHRPLNQSYSMPVAETASTFNEHIVMNAMLKEVSEEERISLIESEIQDTAQIIVDIYSRYYFESKLFERRQSDFLFSKDLEALMLEAQEAAYGDGLDANTRHPFMWICKPHYYSAGLSYYNFPYAFGGLFSKGLYLKYQAEPDHFVDQYHALLRATSVSSVEDTAATIGIDVTDPAFWQETLNYYDQLIDQWIELTGHA
ncbi:TPA: M3 family oligoendopeptidase [Streptococcus suis]